MQVESAETRHLPNLLREHAEGHHHEEVGLEGPQLCEELRVLEFQRLKHGYIVLHGVFLYCTLIEFESASARFVSHGHDTHNLVFVTDEIVERGHRKLGRTHVNYSGLAEKRYHAALDLPKTCLDGIHIENWRIVYCLPGQVCAYRGQYE